MAGGSMRQRGSGSWELRVYVGVDPETGKERYATRTVRGTKRAAQRALQELVEEATRAGQARSSLGALLEQWFSAAAPGWTASTVRQVRSVLNRQLIPSLGAMHVGELTTAQVDAFYADLQRRGLSAGTVRRVHGVLHAALAQAQRWEWIWTNPAAYGSPPAHVPNEIRPPCPADVALLIAKATASDPALAPRRSVNESLRSSQPPRAGQLSTRSSRDGSRDAVIGVPARCRD